MSFSLYRQPTKTIGGPEPTGTEYRFKEQALNLTRTLSVAGVGAGIGYLIGKSKTSTIIGGGIAFGVLTGFYSLFGNFWTEGSGLLVQLGLLPQKTYSYPPREAVALDNLTAATTNKTNQMPAADDPKVSYARDPKDNVELMRFASDFAPYKTGDLVVAPVVKWKDANGEWQFGYKTWTKKEVMLLEGGKGFSDIGNNTIQKGKIVFKAFDVSQIIPLETLVFDRNGSKMTREQILKAI